MIPSCTFFFLFYTPNFHSTLLWKALNIAIIYRIVIICGTARSQRWKVRISASELPRRIADHYFRRAKRSRDIARSDSAHPRIRAYLARIIAKQVAHRRRIDKWNAECVSCGEPLSRRWRKGEAPPSGDNHEKSHPACVIHLPRAVSARPVPFRVSAALAPSAASRRVESRRIAGAVRHRRARAIADDRANPTISPINRGVRSVVFFQLAPALGNSRLLLYSNNFCTEFRRRRGVRWFRVIC